MKNNKRELVIVRHAHRDTSDRDLDNGLSEKGRRQAKQISDYLLKTKLKEALILSSPKARCVETLEPFSKKISETLEIEPLLDEQGSSESQKIFFLRLHQLVELLLESKEKTIVICSHGDVIPSLIKILTGEDADLKKGGLVKILLGTKKAKLESICQSP